METKGKAISLLPMVNSECTFEGYYPSDLMKETVKIRKIITKRGTIACRPVLIHVILMSIKFEHYKQLTKFRTKTARP